jgi:hypothetical protein
MTESTPVIGAGVDSTPFRHIEIAKAVAVLHDKLRHEDCHSGYCH